MDIIEKWTFKQKHKEEGASHVGEWGRVLQVEGTTNANRKSQKYLMFLKTTKRTLCLEQRGEK